MPAPANNDEFLDFVRKSGLVDDVRLWRCLQQLQLRGDIADTPAKLADLLIRDGLLTHLQAEQFLMGKWRNFTLGAYKVLERLGSGSQGSVYLCQDVALNRIVAMKVLPPDRAGQPSARDRFLRECRAIASLAHANVVRVMQIGEVEQTCYLVTEFVDGSTLASIVEQHGPMHVFRAAHYVRQAALGLQHAHERGVVHCHVEPANLMLARTGEVKIIDLGYCRSLGQGWRVDETQWPVDFLSPEQVAQNVGIDACTDVYSLGAVFYFLLTGQPPFPEGTTSQKLHWIQTRAPQAIRDLRPRILPDLALIVMRMMKQDREKRFQTAQEVADALSPWAAPVNPIPPDAEMPWHCKLVQALIVG